MSLGQKVLLVPRPARPRPAAPPSAPTRPARGMSGFWARQVGFRLFVLPKGRSGQMSSMLLRKRKSVVPWANRSVGVPPCPALSRRLTEHGAAQTRPWYFRVLDSTNILESVHGRFCPWRVGRPASVSSRPALLCAAPAPPRPWNIRVLISKYASINRFAAQEGIQGGTLQFSKATRKIPWTHTDKRSYIEVLPEEEKSRPQGHACHG